MFDDDQPRKPKAALKNLEPMSLSDLNAYITELEGEILRAKGEISRKSAHMNAASALFKHKSE